MPSGKRSKFMIAAIVVLAAALCLVSVRHLIVSDKGGFPSCLRLPLKGEEQLHQTIQVVERLEDDNVSFEVSAGKNRMIEAGIVRTDKTDSHWGYSGKFRFKIYRPKLFRNEVLFETTRSFRLNERFAVSLDESVLGAEDLRQTIVCEIEKEDEDKAKGYEAHSDFKFLVPNEFSKRSGDELNVIIVSFDTLRADHLGCYGYERNTSVNIDAFAERNILFSQAFSPSPWTTPAHQSIFTGLYPSAHQNGGVFTFKDNRRTQAVPDDIDFFRSQKTLAGVLKENGYYTTAITAGGFISSELGFGDGFNVYQEYTAKSAASESHDERAEGDSEQIFDLGIKWIEENTDTKFFMFLHTYECHIPYENTFFVPKGVRLDPAEQRIALYDGDIRSADIQFGRLMKKLDTMGLLSNTLVVFLSDHGEEFYDHYTEADVNRPLRGKAAPRTNALDHGHSQYEEMIHVPLILHIPGFTPAKAVIDNQVRLIDVMPTIFDALGIRYGGPMQGVSLLELMRTGERSDDLPSISEFNEGGPERKAIRAGGYKYIWVERPDDCMHYCFNDLAQHELFDLREDPDERNNIYQSNETLAQEYHGILNKQLRTSQEINKKLRAGFTSTGQTKGEIDKDVMENLKALGYL
jgi:arylsulfatase A-like enzyme